MSTFKEASRLKLRFNTTRGLLTAEQLWDLSLSNLGLIVKGIKKELKGTDTDDDLSFLDETKTIDREQQLRFEIAKEIYITKRDEARAEKDAAAIKAHNEEILALIHNKQKEALKEKSVAELEAMLK